MSENIRLFLIDPVTDQVVRELSPNDTITAEELTSGAYNLEARYEGGSVGSMTFWLNGTKIRTENNAPYAALGDAGGNFEEADLPADGETLNFEVRVHNRANGRGKAKDAETFELDFGPAADDPGDGDPGDGDDPIDPPLPENAAPETTDDSYTTDENSALTVPAATGLLDNDSDPDGDALTALLEDGPSNGSLTLNADGSFDYTPDAGFSGADSFTYRASDGDLTSAPTTVSITVDPVAPPPDDDTPPPDDEPAPAGPIRLFLIDPDTDQVVRELSATDTITAEELTSGTYNLEARYEDGSVGSMTFWLNGSKIRTENNAPYAVMGDSGGDFGGVDIPEGDTLVFEVRVHDRKNGRGSPKDTADFALTFEDDAGDGGTPPTNTAPDATADAYGIDENDVLLVNAGDGVLGNDSDPDGDDLTALLDSGPSNGSLTLNVDGSFSYTPDAGFFGQDSFSYRAR